MTPSGDPRLFDLPDPEPSPSPATRSGNGRGRQIAPSPAPAVDDTKVVSPGTDPGAPIVRVLPDVPAIAKTFDYVVPDALRDHVRVGTVVRVALGGRRVGGWVVGFRDEIGGSRPGGGDDAGGGDGDGGGRRDGDGGATERDGAVAGSDAGRDAWSDGGSDGGALAPPGIRLRPLAKVTGWGPPPELIPVARWAARRWVGRTASLLRVATSERAVPGLPPGPADRSGDAPGSRGGGAAGLPAIPAAPARVPVQHAEVVTAALAGPGVTVVRLPPGADTFELAASAVARPGQALVLAPSQATARGLGARLRRSGLSVGLLPDDWAAVRAGRAALGSRAAAWAPVSDLGAVVVIDEHDEVYQEERAPTWHARDVVIERARRAGAPCVLVSPAPTLEALAVADRVLTPSRVAERAGWPMVDVVDMRGEDPMRGGLVSERLSALVQDGRRMVCVLNRTGRAALLACGRCETLARCERCEAAVQLDSERPDGPELVCRRCGETRPLVCASCGAVKLRQLRPGVSRLRDDLAVLAPGAVVEVTGPAAAREASAADPTDVQVWVGTEAVLHQVRETVDLVVFLDLDQELTAPRYRAAEQAFALVVRAARRLGPRAGGGRLLIQTRLPDHEVVQAAVHADPDRVRVAEAARRSLLRFPPVTAMAAISGAGADDYIDAVRAAGVPPGVDVLGPAGGRWLVRAPDHARLTAALADVPRPAARLRIEVDPLRL